MTLESVKDSSIDVRKGAKPKSEIIPITFCEVRKENIQRYFFGSYFKYTFALILTTIVSLLISIAIGFFKIYEQANYYCLIVLISLLIIMRFGSMASSYKRVNIVFSLSFSVFYTLASWFILSKYSLGAYDIRPIIFSVTDTSKTLINICISIFIGFLAHSLSYPMLKNFQSYSKIANIRTPINLYSFCFEAIKSINGFPMRMLKFIYIMCPWFSIIFFFIRNYTQSKNFDILYDSLYLGIIFAISFYKLFYVKNEIRLIINDSFEAYRNYETKRTIKSGKKAVISFYQTERMIMIYATSLVIGPSINIIMALMYVSSFFMSGVAQSIGRVLPLFIVLCTDFIMSSSKLLPITLTQ